MKGPVWLWTPAWPAASCTAQAGGFSPLHTAGPRQDPTRAAPQPGSGNRSDVCYRPQAREAPRLPPCISSECPGDTHTPPHTCSLSRVMSEFPLVLGPSCAVNVQAGPGLHLPPCSSCWSPGKTRSPASTQQKQGQFILPQTAHRAH